MINTPDFLETIRNREGLFSFGSGSRWSLKRKLFSYMFLLVCLLILFLVTAFLLTGQLDSIEEDTYDALDMQMKVFEKDIVRHFDTLAADGIFLSENMTAFLEEYLLRNGMQFTDLTDNADALEELQSLFLAPLLQQMKQESCSGAYLILDATVNSSLENAQSSRTGLYLQTNGYKSSYNPAVLLRGNAEVSRKSDIMPHRKWKLEFNTAILPEYEQLRADTVLPLTKSYRFTDLFTIPGTEIRVMLLCVPMIGGDGTFYGICGFEISESYFASHYAQPTKVDYLTYLFTPSVNDRIDIASGFSCGEDDGYYRAPRGILTAKPEGNGLYSFRGDDITYLGITDSVSLSPNNPDYLLGVLMRKSDFDREMRTEYIKNTFLWLLLLAAAVSSCYYFSRRFLTPILQSLEQLKSEDETAASIDIPEIADLFEFLARKDLKHDQSLSVLAEEKQAAEGAKEALSLEYQRIRQEYEETKRKLSEAESTLNETQQEREQTQTEFEKAQAELERLAYSRQTEIDPDAYAQFLEGIDILTPTERKIFNYYLEGMGVKEIAGILSVKESTIYSHNKNIYGKLGINSLKQLLRYAALMHQQEKKAGGQED